MCQRLPYDLVIDAMIDVGYENPVRSDLVLWYLRYRIAHLFGKLIGGIADPIDNRLTSKTQESVAISCVDPTVHDLISSTRGIHQVVDGLLNGPLVSGVGHNKSASRRMSLSRSVKPPVLTTSTDVPRSASKSRQRPT